ncbi:helix-turn-helix domain-containing protein [Bifidobacterium subtile]|uniref:helix-turn-helix domain-containing protein n=1 Tax=Bifidobacterium subtile TaxID=77635 RepID=UPI002F353BD6
MDDYGLPPFPMPQQVSALTGIPVSTLAYWRFEGSHLPFLKLGRSVRYRRADVLNFIDSHVYSTTAEAKAAK